MARTILSLHRLAGLLFISATAFASTIETATVYASVPNFPVLGQVSVCSQTITSPGSIFCLIDPIPPVVFNAQAESSATLTDSSFGLSGGFIFAGVREMASISHDDLYSIASSGPVFASLTVACEWGLQITQMASYALQNGTLTPCGPVYNFRSGTFLVPLQNLGNGKYELVTFIQGTDNGFDIGNSGLFAGITVGAFVDGNGIPVIATLLTPEPSTWIAGVGLLAFWTARTRKRDSGVPFLTIAGQSGGCEKSFPLGWQYTRRICDRSRQTH